MVTEDIVNVIVDCVAVPSLVKHLQAPQPLREGDNDPIPYEHEVEKASVITLGLLAVKVITLCFSFFSKILLFPNWCAYLQFLHHLIYSAV